MTDEEKATNRWRAKCNGNWPPANPYADPNSPESVAWREGRVPGLEMQSTTLNLRKECRDGGKGRKEGVGRARTGEGLSNDS